MPTKKRPTANKSNMISRKGKNRSNSHSKHGQSGKNQSKSSQDSEQRGYLFYVLITVITIFIVISLAYTFSNYYSAIPDSNLANNNLNNNDNGIKNIYRRGNVIRFEAKIIDEWSHRTSDFTQGLQYIPYKIISQFPMIYEEISKNPIYQSQMNNINTFTNPNNININIPNDYKHGILIETTGLYKQSKIHYLVPYSYQIPNTANNDHPTKRIIHDTDLPGELFGEGITYYHEFNEDNNENSARIADEKSGLTNEINNNNDNGNFKRESSKYFVLTWKKRKIIEYNMNLDMIRKDIDIPKEMREGWGMYYDFNKNEFITTDGSDNLFFVKYNSNTNTFNVERLLSVLIAIPKKSKSNDDSNNNNNEDDNFYFKKLTRLNEIDVVNGWILANVWFEKFIAIISPINGYVYATIDCSNIFTNDINKNRDAVLNGIAYNDELKHLIVTGKLWSKMFAIEIPQFILEHTPQDLLYR